MTDQSITIKDFEEAESPIIYLDHVSKEFRRGFKKLSNLDTAALKDISLKIYKGEFAFIVGDSGSGKTTLIRLLMRELTATKGKVYVSGRDIGRLRAGQIGIYRRSIGVVFQNFKLLANKTVYNNVAFALHVTGASKSEIKRMVPKVLNMVGLEDKANAYPNELSGGQQQRVAIARALVNNPLILLADEPTGNLDPNNSWEIMTLLNDINKRGTTVVVVTHNHEIVDEYQKRVITLDDGRIISDEENSGYTTIRKD